MPYQDYQIGHFIYRITVHDADELIPGLDER